jgi:hypothetical protein
MKFACVNHVIRALVHLYADVGLQILLGVIDLKVNRTNNISVIDTIVSVRNVGMYKTRKYISMFARARNLAPF